MTTRQPGPTGAATPATRRDDGLDAVAGLLAIALVVLVDGQWSGPVRLLLTVGFACYVPGRAIVSNWPRMARWSGVAMPMVFSLAVLTLLAMIMLWAGTWHPLSLFEAEAWLSVAGLAVGVVRRHRSGTGVRPAEPPPQGRETPTC